MNVRVNVASPEWRGDIEWPDDWLLPSPGDWVNLPDDDEAFYVRNVDWYPRGSKEARMPDPFVVICLALTPPPRP